MLKKTVISSFCLMVLNVAVAADRPIDLSGKWEFQLGQSAADKTYAAPFEEETLPSDFNDTIVLPGTTDTNKKCQKTTGSTEGTYTRRYKHIGRAWYRRDIEIPKAWKDRDVELFIERALWKTTVYVDGQKRGEYDSLATPHVYNLGQLAPVKHSLAICVDNSMIYNIGDKSHSYSENMQTIWNGMVGQLELRPLNTMQIKAVRTIWKDDGSQLLIAVNNTAGEPKDCSITIELKGKADEEVIVENIVVEPGCQNILCPLPKELIRWHEFNPYLYDAKITVEANTDKTIWQSKLGFCQPAEDGTYITVNGRPTFLRGNLDNCHFPLTGYPPTDKAEWLRIWKIYKDFALNNVRFHSWCPPEAAFAAADEAGIYLQVEAGVWIDSWMKRRVASVPQGISDDNVPVRDFVASEMKRIIDAYGHHPSFIMFCIGNELGSSDFKTLAQLVTDTRQYDQTSRLYSCSTARLLQPEVDDYFVSHENLAGPMRGLHGPKTNWTYDSIKTGAPDTPLILHELGQWPVWPRWSEIKKYKGVVEARNLASFKTLADENNLLPYDEEFQIATGKFSVLLYKAEMEAALRTKSYTGFHMLGLQDYMGQGEALIGILDMFYDLKPGIINSKAYRQFCSPVVPLAQFEKYTWNSGDTFWADLKISNFSADDIAGPVVWKLVTEKDSTIAQGAIEERIAQGTVTDLGKITANLATDKPLACTLEVSVKDTLYRNSWPIWIYPAKQEITVPESVVVSEGLDENTLQALDSGKSVLLMASDCLNRTNSQKNNFMPVYWSVGWFPGQDATLGLTCDPKHPLFKNFPTSNHCDWQWYDIVNESQAMIVNDLPAGYRPIIEPIDDFHLARRLAAVFETKVGKGKLLVCAYPLQNRLDSPACRQMYNSLLTYAEGKEFHPKTELPLDWLKKNLSPQPKAKMADQKAFGSKDAALWVQVADKADKADIPYSGELDIIKTQLTGYGYKLAGDGIWINEEIKAVAGKSIRLEIACPRGIQGTVYVRFNDWPNANRTGSILFENRPFVLGEHPERQGRWVGFDTMREDALDNMLVLQADAATGPNLRIDEFVFIPD